LPISNHRRTESACARGVDQEYAPPENVNALLLFVPSFDLQEAKNFARVDESSQVLELARGIAPEPVARAGLGGKT
jgi:hypothetical protein